MWLFYLLFSIYSVSYSIYREGLVRLFKFKFHRNNSVRTIRQTKHCINSLIPTTTTSDAYMLKNIHDTFFWTELLTYKELLSIIYQFLVKTCKSIAQLLNITCHVLFAEKRCALRSIEWSFWTCLNNISKHCQNKR
jgi:hypothetical protein